MRGLIQPCRLTFRIPARARSLVMLLIPRYRQFGVVPDITAVLGHYGLEADQSNAVLERALAAELIAINVHWQQRRFACSEVDRAGTTIEVIVFGTGLVARALPSCIGIFCGRHIDRVVTKSDICFTGKRLDTVIVCRATPLIWV